MDEFVTVVRAGSSTAQSVRVDNSSTVSAVLSQLNITLQPNEQMEVSGRVVTPTSTVYGGDTILITKNVKGGN